MSSKTRNRLLIVLLLCSAGLLAKEKAATPQTNITFSRETTGVSGPLNKDGYIDYMLVINQRISVGVTPENNANVLLWKAIGPLSEGTEVGPDFFKLMGTEMLPKTGDYFVTLEDFAQEKLKLETNSLAWNRVLNHEWTITSQVWSAAEYPEIAEWLKYNEKPLALVTEASHRPRYYSPMIPLPTRDGELSDTLISAWLPGAQATRYFARSLSARAMLHLGNGRPEAAWEDLMACHRLGRLMAAGPTLVEVLVGYAIGEISSDAILTYIDHVKPNARQAALLARQLDQVLPLPQVADRVDLCERFSYLDVVQHIACPKDNSANPLKTILGSPTTINEVILNVLKTGAEERNMWNVVLKQGNARYDQYVKALRIKDPIARLAAVQAFERDREKHSAYLNSTFKTLAKIANSGSFSQGVGEVLGDMMEPVMMAGLSGMVKSELRVLQRQEHLQVALALSAYHADQGNYPEKLLDLKPKYLQDVPLDRFSGKAILYRRSQQGYLFYSVAVNGKDDQGHTWQDEPAGDDLSVRMPRRLPGKPH